MVGMGECEADVLATALAEPLDGIGDSNRLLHIFGELAEVAFAKLEDQGVLVSEVVVDDGGGVLDFFGYGAHGNAFVTYGDEKLARGVEDGGADLVFFAFSAFFGAHFADSYNGNSKYNSVKSNVKVND